MPLPRVLSRFSRVRLCNYGLEPARLLRPRDSPGKNTGLPCPPPGDFPDPGIKPGSHVSCFGKQVLYCQGHLEAAAVVNDTHNGDDDNNKQWQLAHSKSCLCTSSSSACSMWQDLQCTWHSVLNIAFVKDEKVSHREVKPPAHHHTAKQQQGSWNLNSGRRLNRLQTAVLESWLEHTSCLRLEVRVPPL